MNLISGWFYPTHTQSSRFGTAVCVGVNRTESGLNYRKVKYNGESKNQADNSAYKKGDSILQEGGKEVIVIDTLSFHHGIDSRSIGCL